jgi:hypothetical protein
MFYKVVVVTHVLCTEAAAEVGEFFGVSAKFSLSGIWAGVRERVGEHAGARESERERAR